MRKLMTFFVVLIFSVPNIIGQGIGTVTLGTGTTTNSTTGHPTPYGTYYKNHRVQYLILASELTSLGMVAGSITAIGFNVANLNNCSQMPNYTIKIKDTYSSVLTTSFDNTVYTTVWTHPNFLPVLGWNTHNFTNHFSWNGTSNILIDICFDLIPGSYTQNASVYYTVTPVSLANFYRSDSQVACGTSNAATVSPNRANMQITGMLASCVPPSNLTATNPTTGSIVLDWNPVGTETMWNLKYGAPGFDPTTQGTLISGITAHPFTLTGLTPVTNYEFYIQADCGGGSLSSWGGPGAFTTTSDPLSGNYTINSTLPSGGTNYNSFNEFAIAMNLGGFAGPVVVDVVAGTGPYTEQVMLGELPNSSSVNTLTINGNGEVLQFLSTNTNERGTLKFDATDYVTVNNLIIKALGSVTGEYGWAVWLTNEANFNTFTACQFIADMTSTLSNFVPFVTSNSATGATTAGMAASDLTIQNCTAIGGYYGMVINGPTTASGEPPAQNSLIINNDIKDFRLYGLYIRGQIYATISGNSISRPTRQEVSTSYMLYLTQKLTGTVVTKNRISDFAGSAVSTSSAYGIYGTTITADQGHELLIANNLVYGFQNMNGGQYGAYLLTTSNTKFYHNTVFMDHIGHTGSSIIRGLYHSGNAAVIDIRNNIISVMSNSTGTKHCMYFAQTAGNEPVLTSDNNVLHMGATAGTNHLVYWSATNFTTYPDWRQAAGGMYDQNSISADPMFVNSLTGDLMPQNPAVNNIGANLLAFVPDDFYGVARTATPDPGAIEFDPTAIGTLMGTVTEASKGPIQGARVFSGPYQAYTNESGNYMIENLLEGTYTFSCEAEGYFTATAPGVVIITDSTTVQNFTLNFAEITVNPASIEETLNPDMTSTKYLNISNPGGTAPLSWSASLTFSKGSDNSNEPLVFGETIPVSNADPMKDACITTSIVQNDPTEDTWDLLQSFLLSAPGQQAVGTNGQYIYSSFWNTPGQFSRYTLQGVWLETFTIAGVGGVRDLTYDGEYFYGGAASTLIYKLDLDNEALVGTIPSPVNVRHISYDPVNDGFWLGDWTSLRLVSRTGTTIITGPTLVSVYGSAYDPYTEGGPFLWFFAQVATSGCGTVNDLVQIQKFNIATNSLTGYTFCTTNIPGYVPGTATTQTIAGGAFATDLLFPGKFVLMVNVQQSPNLVAVFELTPLVLWMNLGTTTGVVAPGGSEQIAVNFDATGLELGTYQAGIKITHDGQPTGPVTVPVTLTVSGIQILYGDANCDGDVNLLDVITMANYVLGLNPQPFCFENADVNMDGTINVNDLIATISIILGTDIKTLFQNPGSSDAHIFMNQNSIVLESDGTLAGLQFEIQGLNTGELELLLPGYELFTHVSNNKLTALLLNMNNTPIPPGRIELFKIHGNRQMTWGEVIGANTSANEVRIQKHVSWQESEFVISAYPNPSNGHIVASVSIPAESGSIIRILDIMGREVYKVHDGLLTAGAHQFDVDLTGKLGKGIYFLKVDASDVKTSVLLSKQLKLVLIN